MIKKNSGEYWDSRLTISQKNPFPLAPGELVESGKVNPENYRNANWRFGKFCSKKMEPELYKLPRGGIHALGSGLGRDFMWIRDALYLDCAVHIFDVSEVACQNANEMLEFQRLPKGQNVRLQKISVVKTEIMAGWKSGQIDETGVVAIYASQFLEHQGKNTGKFLSHFAQFLREDTRRKIFLVLPRLEDNPPDRVRWNSAVPLLDHQWQNPLQKAFGDQPLSIDARGTHLYFNRTYTFFRVGVK